MNHIISRRGRGVTLTFFVLLLAGCAQGSIFKSRGKEFDQSGPQHPVVKIITLWQEAEGVGLDQKTTRGFGGQVLFLTYPKQLPAKLNGGTVRVYLFDDQGPPEEQVKPIHKFEFSADAWQFQLQPSSFGPAYGLFIPYVRKGLHEAHCSLRVQYTPDGGVPIYSEMATVVLPGIKPGGKDPTGLDVLEKAKQPADDRTVAPATNTTTAPASTSTVNAAAEPRRLLEQVAATQAAAAPRRLQAQPLTPAERARIISEVQAKQVKPGRPDRSQAQPAAADDEMNSPPAAKAKRAARNPRRHALDEVEDRADGQSEVRELNSLLNTPPARRQAVRRPARHLLDENPEAEVDDEFARQMVRPKRANPARQHAAPAAPAESGLDDGDASGQQTSSFRAGRGGGLNTVTISVPEQALAVNRD